MAKQAAKSSLQDAQQRREHFHDRALNPGTEEGAIGAAALLEAVLRQMPGGVIIVNTASNRIILGNHTALKLWPGCSYVSELERYFEANCYHADGRPCGRSEMPLTRSIKTGKDIANQEIRFRRSDGSLGTMTVDSAVVRKADRTVVAAVMTCEDITEHKRLAEREQAALLQLRDLSAKLESVREEERTRIALEIHDELGQALTALSFDLAWLHKKVRGEGRVIKEKIQLMIEESKRTIHSIRRMAAELRPSVLDDLGLIPAIEWQLSEFQKRTRIRARLRLKGERPIDPARSTVLFRIVQEALTNVMRHAEATRVHVSLRIDDRSLALQIDDNGRGISKVEITCPSSLGIAGMTERVNRLGGMFRIGPGPRAGTRLEVFLPLEGDPKKALEPERIRLRQPA
jgi:signal transduction histidine kinase